MRITRMVMNNKENLKKIKLVVQCNNDDLFLPYKSDVIFGSLCVSTCNYIVTMLTLAHAISTV